MCDAGWSYLGGKCFKIFHDYLTWNESETACNRNGAYLASITSSREQQFVAGKQLLLSPFMRSVVKSSTFDVRIIST